MGQAQHHHPPTPSSEEEGEPIIAPSSLEEGVGGGGPTRKLLLHRAAEMRRNPTEPERRLWMELRDSRFYDYKFRRQVVIGSRIVDFFAPRRAWALRWMATRMTFFVTGHETRGLNGRLGLP